MLSKNQTITIHFQDQLGKLNGKMGHGALHYLENPVVCVIDTEHAGKRLRDVIDFGKDCPVVKTVAEAAALGAEVLILGMAPSGGRLPATILEDLDNAVELGLSIINGLHEALAPRYPDLKNPQWIWDIRQEPANLPIATRQAAGLNNKRILTVGTDMAIGKMTVGLEIIAKAKNRGIDSAFLATGQIGIMISGRGVPLDTIRVDYAGGAIEQMVMNAQDKTLVVIEGQGAIIHPGSTSTLPLMRGACPTHLVLCHRAGMHSLVTNPDISVPPLNELIELYEDLAAGLGTFPRPTTVAVAVNTSFLSEQDARRELERIEQEAGIHATDVVRFGAGSVLDLV
jgi:uncharacterized NAD-dependent epimerase/dehydratase family protein